MTNIELFKYSGLHKEQILDPYYLDESIPVIPVTANDKNALVENNARLLQLISSFGFLIEHGKQSDDPEIEKLIDEVIDILIKTREINLSPFAQFFMVYDSSYASFVKYPIEEQRKFINEMIRCYGERRHKLYLTHGYTNSMLQVVNDNYSHKRKSVSSIKKVREILDGAGLVYGSPVEHKQRFYFLPDKGDKEEFLEFKRQQGIVMKFARNKQDKLPDLVICIDEEYYIVELKHINGCGGGQDKQLNEIIDFVKYPEQNSHVHYISYLDGDYSNRLHDESNRREKKNKIGRQYKSILKWLKRNPGYYFLNTAGLKMLIRQMVRN